MSDSDWNDGHDYGKVEQKWADDPSLVQPEKNNAWKWIGGLVFIGLLITAIWIISTTVASWNVLIPIAATVVVVWVTAAYWIAWRPNRKV